MYEDEVPYPSGFGLKDVVSWGTTGLVVHDESSNTVVKVPFDQTPWRAESIERERQIYERLTERGGHDGLLSYHGMFERGIRLEHASSFDLHSFHTGRNVDVEKKLSASSMKLESPTEI